MSLSQAGEACFRLDRAAQVGKQRADGWSENDEPSDSENGYERDDQSVFDQTLR
jgi:hypothetical protein